MTTGKLLGSGRANDVYEIDDTWVLRRNREGWGDSLAEGAVMEHVRAHGYPVPRVRLADSTPTELVLRRLSGPTMVQACLAGSLDADQAGATVADLLRRLHTIPARHSAEPGHRVLHLDLHPDNVMLTPDGPQVIDWSNAEEGPPGLGWAISAMILAQVAVDDAEPLAAPARTMLAALLADPSRLTDTGLAEARRRRAANATRSRREVGRLGEAEDLIRGLLRWCPDRQRPPRRDARHAPPLP